MARRVKYSASAFEKKSREYLSSIRYTRPLLLPSGESVKNELGEPALEQVWIEPPNTADWALYLGISKSALTTLYRARYPEIYDIIKTVLEAYTTREHLTRKTGAEAIKFNLNSNFGWRDGRSADEGVQEQAAAQPPLALCEKFDRLRELLREYSLDVEGGGRSGELDR